MRNDSFEEAGFRQQVANPIKEEGTQESPFYSGSSQNIMGSQNAGMSNLKLKKMGSGALEYMDQVMLSPKSEFRKTIIKDLAGDLNLEDEEQLFTDDKTKACAQQLVNLYLEVNGDNEKDQERKYRIEGIPYKEYQGLLKQGKGGDDKEDDGAEQVSDSRESKTLNDETTSLRRRQKMVKLFRKCPMCLTIPEDFGRTPFSCFDVLGLMVIDHQGPPYMIFNIVTSICCLVSAYIYAFIAAHRVGEDDPMVIVSNIIFETVFTLDILTNFVLSYTDVGSGSDFPVRDVVKIAKRYFKGRFFWDLLPIIPLQDLPSTNKRSSLFYLVKLIRLQKGFEILNVPVWVSKLKVLQMEKSQELVKTEPEVANDPNLDHNKIEEIIIVTFAMKIFKLMILIFNFSYLLAMFWYIMCKAVEDFYHSADYTQTSDAESHPDVFIVNYNIQDKSYKEVTIIMTYFAFTSLSTVGFGDYAPISNLERAIGAFMLLSGVAIFSYIMGNFIEMIDQFKRLHEGLDDGDNLSKFFGTIQHFNNGIPMLPSMKSKIEMHFDYVW